jgi:hypothetical protein
MGIYQVKITVNIPLIFWTDYKRAAYGGEFEKEVPVRIQHAEGSPPKAE